MDLTPVRARIARDAGLMDSFFLKGKGEKGWKSGFTALSGAR